MDYFSQTGEKELQTANRPMKNQHIRWRQTACLRGWKEKSCLLESRRGTVDVASVLSVQTNLQVVVVFSTNVFIAQ